MDSVLKRETRKYSWVKHMKICYLADGSSIHVQRQIRCFVEKGNEVHLISFRKGSVDKNVHLHYIKPRIKFPFSLNYLINIKKVKETVKAIKPDLLHAYYLTSYGFLGACCDWKPFIISCIGSDILITPQKSILHKWLTQYTLKKADVITSVSNLITDNLIRLGTKPDKIETFAFGVDLDLFSPASSNKEPQKNTLLSLRSLKPVYNIETLLKGISYLKKECSSFKLVLAGAGPQEKKLKQMAACLGISDCVNFTGAIPHFKVLEYVRNSDIYISTSLSDGASTSLLEAMASGLFPIVTEIQGNQDWITDGWNGFLVPVGNAKILAKKIKEAMDNDELRRLATSRNVKIVRERGSWQKSMKKMESVYKTVVKLYSNI